MAEKTMTETTRFVTFYSYKGGVGRTSALVNVAILLALQGNNVVILDFDLEAPGTGPYFKKLDPLFDEQKEGLLEYFVAALDGNGTPNLYEMAFDLTDSLNGRNGGRLWVVNSGNTQDENYTARLEQLRWSEIFEKQHGELLLTNFKNQIVAEFERPDYVLIDSRTGITETGGICTRYLADLLVILTSLNDQNIFGTARIYKALSEEAKECVLVAANVPVGMPYAADQLFSQRIDAFITAFGKPAELSIYYYPVLSLSEELPALLTRLNSNKSSRSSALFGTDPLVQSYIRLASIIIEREKGQVSYMNSLSRAVNELSHYYYTKEPPSAISQLKQYYSNRRLGRLVLDLFELMKEFLEKPADEWNKSEFNRLKSLVQETEHVPLKIRAIEALQVGLHGSIQRWLGSGKRMTSSLEAYLDSEHLEGIVLQEIAKEHFEWPIDYLQRTLNRLPKDNHFDLAWCLYNLSHCLEKSGQTKAVKDNLRRFLEELDQVDSSKFPANTKANVYFCAALAYKQLGLKAEAKSMCQKSREYLDNIKADVQVFSPLNYKDISMEEFRQQLEALCPK